MRLLLLKGQSSTIFMVGRTPPSLQNQGRTTRHDELSMDKTAFTGLLHANAVVSELFVSNLRCTDGFRWKPGGNRLRCWVGRVMSTLMTISKAVPGKIIGPESERVRAELVKFSQDK